MTSPAPFRTFTLPQILTKDEIDDLWASFGVTTPGLFHTLAVRRLRRLMPRINRTLGCDNNIDYIAYAIEHVFNQAKNQVQPPPRRGGRKSAGTKEEHGCDSNSTPDPAQ